MTKKHLFEAATLVSESASQDGTWKVKIISEGKGSSGTYTAALLENHHAAFDNLLSFRNHPTGWDGPETRDFTMIAGEIIGETWIEKDERDLTAVYGNFRPDPEYADKIARYKDKLGLSIYIEGSGYFDEDLGEFIVDWFNPADPYASVDVVIAPGARGKFMESMRKTYEAALAEKEEPSVTSAQDGKEIKMDQEFKDAFDALTAQVASLVAEKQAAKAEAAQAEADADAGRTAVEAYDAQVTAIVAADLPEKIAESLRAQAKEGKDVAPLIEQALVFKEAAEASLEVKDDAAPGRVMTTRKVESATDLGKVFG